MEVPPSREEEAEPFFDNLSSGIWSPRLKQRISPLDIWSGTILIAAITWTFFLFLGMLSTLLLQWAGVSDRTILALIATGSLGTGTLLVLWKVLSDRKFFSSFRGERGLWYFSSVRSGPAPVVEILDSAEEYLRSLGLVIRTAERGTTSSGSRFIRIEGTPMMVVISYDLTEEDLMIEVEVGPRRRALKKELFELMGSFRDWSAGSLQRRLGDLGPDPRDPGTLKV